MARPRSREEIYGLYEVHVMRSFDAVYAQDVGATVWAEHVGAGRGEDASMWVGNQLRVVGAGARMREGILEEVGGRQDEA